MTELRYMPVVVNDEMAETANLSNEELGALTRIKWAMWRAGGYLADDGKLLARIARAGSRWGKIAPAVMALLTVAGGKVSSASLLTTLLITHERRAKAAKAVSAKLSKPDHGLNASKSLKNNNLGARQEAPEHMQLKSELENTALRALSATAAVQRGESAGLSNKQASEGVPGSVEDCSRGLLQVRGDRMEDRDIVVYGSELLVARVQLRLLKAKGQIANWLVALEPCGDEAESQLARILANADLENLRGPSFVTQVDGRVADAAREAVFGRSLKFPPHQVKRHG